MIKMNAPRHGRANRLLKIDSVKRRLPAEVTSSQIWTKCTSYLLCTFGIISYRKDYLEKRIILAWSQISDSDVLWNYLIISEKGIEKMLQYSAWIQLNLSGLGLTNNWLKGNRNDATGATLRMIRILSVSGELLDMGLYKLKGKRWHFLFTKHTQSSRQFKVKLRLFLRYKFFTLISCNIFYTANYKHFAGHEEIM